MSRRRDNSPLLHRWRQFPAAIASPSFELTTEEFAPVLATYKALRLAGERFDPMLVALMTALERQARDTDADPDSDASDEGIENELSESFIQGG